MIIGLDFDNTIVCYDKAIATLAPQRFHLPDYLPLTKVAIRNHLRSQGLDDAWTRFQGELYGPGMAHAEPFETAIEVIRQLRRMGHAPVVISHRSRFPYLGERHDLHAFASSWISNRLEDVLTSFTFHESKAEKVAMIASVGCEVFLDDLPEILSDPLFPKSTIGVLFSPDQANTSWDGKIIHSWVALLPLVQARA